MKNKYLLFTGILIVCTFVQSLATVHLITTPGLSFSPSSLTAQIGDTIEWNGSSIHTTTSTSVPNGASSWNHNFATAATFQYVITTAGTYNYKCNNHAGMTGSFTVSAPVGIINKAVASFNFYPNPFQKYLILNLKNYTNTVNVEIYDILGKQYFSNKYVDIKDNKITIDTDEFNPGLYFIYVITNGKKDVFRIMKNSVSAS